MRECIRFNKSNYNFAEPIFVMVPHKQVFETESKLRWNTFKWVSRILIFLLILIVPVVWISLANINVILLPKLEKTDYARNKNLVLPKGLTKADAKRYQGFQKFLEAKNQNNIYIAREARGRNRRLTSCFLCGLGSAIFIIPENAYQPAQYGNTGMVLY